MGLLTVTFYRALVVTVMLKHIWPVKPVFCLLLFSKLLSLFGKMLEIGRTCYC